VDIDIPEPNEPGAAVPQPECRGLGLGDDSLVGSVVPVPLYANVTAQGNNTEYEISGFGCFKVLAYWFSQKYHEPQTPEDFRCPGDDDDDDGPGAEKFTCLVGYFEEDCVVQWGEPGGPDYGVVVVKLTE
jgi:hypothetical protein